MNIPKIFKTFSRSPGQSKSAPTPEVCFDTGVIVECPTESCGRNTSCRLDQITGLIVSEAVVCITAAVNPLDDCGAEGCADESFVRMIPRGNSTDLLELLLPDEIVTSFK